MDTKKIFSLYQHELDEEFLPKQQDSGNQKEEAAEIQTPRKRRTKEKSEPRSRSRVKWSQAEWKMVDGTEGQGERLALCGCCR